MISTPDSGHVLTLGEIMNPPAGMTPVYHINAGKPDEVCAEVKFIACAGPGRVWVKFIHFIDDKHVPGFVVGIHKIVEIQDLVTADFG